MAGYVSRFLKWRAASSARPGEGGVGASRRTTAGFPGPLARCFQILFRIVFDLDDKLWVPLISVKPAEIYITDSSAVANLNLWLAMDAYLQVKLRG